jgi:hypothetical protein
VVYSALNLRRPTCSAAELARVEPHIKAKVREIFLKAYCQHCAAIVSRGNENAAPWGGINRCTIIAKAVGR